ncbi:MAG: hypothetical protein AB3N22_03090 [Ruegeria sp.]
MTQILRLALPAFALLALGGLTHAFGLTQSLGAHPWWADKVIWIGLPIGVLLATTTWALAVPRVLRLVGFGLLTAVAFGIAHFGKTRFAASFAEDALAGHAWYFGWIATCALAVALIASLLSYSPKAD